MRFDIGLSVEDFNMPSKLVDLVCVGCGGVFQGSSNNQLRLCPVCYADRKRGLRIEREKSPGYSPTVRGSGQKSAAALAKALAASRLHDFGMGRPVSIRDDRPAFGPAYGFASLGDLYRANDGRLVGKRIRRDLMQVAAARRPKDVLEVWG